MKKRTAAIGALVSLLPLGQPLVIGTGAAFTSSALMLATPKKAKAENAEFHLKRAIKKGNAEDWYGSISEFNKAIKINPKDGNLYWGRGIAKIIIDDMKGACSDWRKASSLGIKETGKLFKENC